MKLQLRTMSVLLLLAGPAASQVRVSLPGGINPYIGSPVRLPAPSISPAIGMRIELPSPRLNPGLTVVLAPTPSAAVATMGVFPVLPLPMIPNPSVRASV